MRKVLAVVMLVLLVGALFASTALAAKTALLVTQSGEPVNAAEEAVKQKLAEMGFKVTVVEDALANSLKPEDFSVIVVSSTTSSGEFVVHTDYLETDTPTLSWEAWTYDDYGFTDSPTNPTDKSIEIVSGASHPIIEGLSGKVDIYTSYGEIHAATSAFDGVVVLAKVSGNPCLMVMDKGAEVNGKVIAGKRVGFPGFNDSFEMATDAYWKLFENAINWLTK